ncbi:MAG: hypothetical protein J6M47_07550 [Clostridia bacterium]|nr:hypothetical protein [Clostridia bacterium]
MRMPFQGKIERAQKLSSEQRAARDAHGRGRYDDELTPGDLMEKGDGCAMIIAAMITIVPACLIVLAILAAVGYFFVVR